MNCLNSSLLGFITIAGVTIGVGVGAWETAGVGVRVPLLSVRATLAGSFPLVGGGF